MEHEARNRHFEALTQQPDLLWLGQLLSRSGKNDRATDVLERAVEAAPEQPETWLTLFSHQLASGSRKPAENTLDRAADRLAEPARQLVLAHYADDFDNFGYPREVPSRA
jgi:Tfp pilus assembly protein PilF